jgi:hypothetical protein
MAPSYARPLGEPREAGVEVEVFSVSAVRGHAVLEAAAAAERVLRQLLTHDPGGGVLGKAEPPPELDPRLQGIALCRRLVRDAAKVPRLVREDGDRTGGLA